MAKAELKDGDANTWAKWVALRRSEVVWGQMSSILSLSDPKKCVCFLSSPPLENWVGVPFKLPPPVPAPRHPPNQERTTITSSLIFHSIKLTDCRVSGFSFVYFNDLSWLKTGKHLYSCDLNVRLYTSADSVWWAKESYQQEVHNPLWTLFTSLQFHIQVILCTTQTRPGRERRGKPRRQISVGLFLEDIFSQC